MTLVKGSVGLGIRERYPDTKLLRYNREACKNWLDDLPMADLSETSRQVYQRLLKSNGLLINPKVRGHILADIDEPAAHICASLQKHYTVHTVSLTEKQRKIANLCQAIQLELAIGYKTIIEDLISDENYTSELLYLAVNQVLYNYHQIQIRSYQLYQELPKGIWREIHLLYQLAEQNQFHEKSVTVNNRSVRALGTYKKIMLLATTNPNQLRQNDINVIANALPAFLKKLSIDSDPEEQYDFLANLHSDASPFYHALIKGRFKAYYRGFRIGKLVEFIQDELKTAEQNNRKSQLEDALLHHLLRAWGTMATRTFSRIASSGNIRVGIGLAGCHYLINKELYGDEAPPLPLEGDNLLDALEGSLKNAVLLDEDEYLLNTSKSKHPDWNTSNSGPKLKTDTMWDLLYKKKSVQETDDTQEPYEFMETPSQIDISPKYEYQDAGIINMSPGGYCLKLDGVLPKQTQAGEIIGLLELAKDGRYIWNIGNIRWIKRHQSKGIQVGVQLLAPNAIPVYGQVAKGKLDDRSYQRCLLLPALSSIGQATTILTSPMPFSVKQRVRLKTSEQTYDIRLTRLISSGHSYQQFEYDRLDVNHGDSLNQDDPDLDSVWELI